MGSRKKITRDVLTRNFSHSHASPCEKCNRPLPEHEWVTMNHDGFVEDCSILKELKKSGTSSSV